MGVPRNTLIMEARHILGGPLSEIGYSFEENPIDGLVVFWFVKEANIDGKLFHIIEFAPSGLSEDNLFDMGIQLIRRNFHDHFTISSDFTAHVDLGVPLAPNLWQAGGEKFYRWHFVSSEEVQSTYKDILEKLIEYGVPFLEDPAANNETWQRWGITSFKRPR